jgi:hypothetical protein
MLIGQRSRTAGETRAGRRRFVGRWGTLVGVLWVVLVLGGLSAGTAQAAEPEANVTEWACDQVTVVFTNFPNLPNNTVTIKVRIDGETASYKTYKFNGPEATIVVPIAVPPGHHSLDVFSKWNTNNVKGGHDQPLKGGITCEADPEFTIEKKQRRGGKGAYSSETIPNGKVGEVVEYGIVLKNTGNEPVKFSNFSDPNCDEGTITGGPGETAIPPGGFSNFFCKHTLTEADHTAGSYCNVASVTGTPEGEGAPKSKESNEVCAELPTPKNKVEFTCTGITFYFEGFPNMPGNTVKMRIRVDGVYTPPKPEFQEYTFNGPTGSYTFPLNLSPGHHSVDGLAKWNTNGFRGGSDQTLKNGINCE